MSHEVSVKQRPAYRSEMETERAIQEFMKTVCLDRALLLGIVAGGLVHWKNVAGKAFKGFQVSDQMLNDIFGFLMQEAGPEPGKQLDKLLRAGLVNLKLAKLQGLAQFIQDERHLDAVLEKNLPDDDERAAIREQMLLMMKGLGTVH